LSLPEKTVAIDSNSVCLPLRFLSFDGGLHDLCGVDFVVFGVVNVYFEENPFLAKG
jgi:hypothetical protein